MASSVGAINPFRYRGYYYDTETKLYYVQSRYYDPVTGRFVNADDPNVLLLTQGDILGANLFSYANNNPIMNVDPDGHFAVPWQIKVGLAAGIASALWEIGNYVVKNWFAKKSAWNYIKGLGAAAGKGFIRGFVVGIISTLPKAVVFGLIGGTFNFFAQLMEGNIKSVGAGISAFMNGWTAGVGANAARIVIGNLARMKGWKGSMTDYVNYTADLLFGYGLARFFKW